MGTARRTEREGERKEATGKAAEREERRRRDREPDKPRRGKKNRVTG